MSLERELRKNLPHIYNESKKNRIRLAFRFGSARIGNGQHAASFDISVFWDRLYVSGRDDT